MSKKVRIIIIVAAVVCILALACLLLLRQLPNTSGGSAGNTTDVGTDNTTGQSDAADATEGTAGTDQTVGVVVGVGQNQSERGDSTTPTRPDGTGPTQKPDTTEPSQNPGQTDPTQGAASGVDVMTWEEWDAMSGEAQDAYIMEVGIPAYLAWKDAALADYNARHPEETITGDPVIDLTKP